MKSFHARSWIVTAANEAIDKGQVDLPVQIEIRQHRSETGAAPPWIGQTQFRRFILEEPARALHPKRMLFVDQMGDKDVKETVAVHVPHADAHVPGGLAQG